MSSDVGPCLHGGRGGVGWSEIGEGPSGDRAPLYAVQRDGVSQVRWERRNEKGMT